MKQRNWKRLAVNRPEWKKLLRKARHIHDCRANNNDDAPYMLASHGLQVGDRILITI